MPRSLAELIPRIPEPVRVVLRNAVWSYGRATARVRPLPDFLIIGAQRAGTTALYEYLRRHPGIAGPAWKEVNFFDVHHRRGQAWYRGHFPIRSRAIVGEASPSYLFHPLAPERVAALLPEARLIALLRNPIERALSHYHHEVDLGREPLPFEEALEREEERMRGELERMLGDPAYFSDAWWNHTYVARGRYAEQLERWLAFFPREQLLVLTSEELFAQPRQTYACVLDFLGAGPHALGSYPRVFARDYSEMLPETRLRLADYYAEPNAQISELLGRELGWT